ncbi:hypothetical protein C8Q80DRAFT_1270227 [Daedaleopsis nitida]|nr:hypothetical protein C8Q80DRAFT_1270227 [Daedaleopsis nitida]
MIQIITQHGHHGRHTQETLGNTGEGLRSAEDITESFPESFRNKWEEVKADCLFFFEMRDLLAQRPNLTPVGLGNAVNTEIETSVLLPNLKTGSTEQSASDEDILALARHTVELDQSDLNDSGPREGDDGVGSEPDSVRGDEGDSDDPESSESGDDGRNRKTASVRAKGAKRKLPMPIATASAKPSKAAKTPARTQSVSTSRSATPTSSKGKVKSAKGFLAGLDELANNKELARRQEIELAKEKIRYNSTKVQAKTEVQLQRDKLKFNLRALQMKHCMELQMAQLKYQAQPASTSATGMNIPQPWLSTTASPSFPLNNSQDPLDKAYAGSGIGETLNGRTQDDMQGSFESFGGQVFGEQTQ